MPLSDEQRERIAAFRTYIADAVGNDDRYGPATRCDREDESTLAMRFAAGPSCWFEIALRPSIPQIRVGFLTDDRWRSEELEQAIQDSGDTMEEFVEVGFEEAGLAWEEPPVEHYRDSGKYFYFATPLALEDLDELEQESLRSKVLRMLDGYLIAFGPVLEADDDDEAHEHEPVEPAEKADSD